MASQHGDANLNKYSSLMDLNLGSYGDHSAEAKLKQQLYDTPLFSHEFQQNAAQKPPRGQGIQFSQYALLGRQLLTPGLDPPTGTDWPLLLNTNTPWSAFICGLQGSGKSHTLACMLENCLMKGDRHGELSAPMSGFLFHYDVHSSGKPCEAAYLASHIPVNVLVSPGNLWDMTKIYQQIPNFGQNLQLYPLLLKDNHLNASRMKHLMAVNDKEGKQPLYMEVSALHGMLSVLVVDNLIEDHPYITNLSHRTPNDLCPEIQSVQDPPWTGRFTYRTAETSHEPAPGSSGELPGNTHGQSAQETKSSLQHVPARSRVLDDCRSL